jgi:hypothetical protein
MIYNDRAKIQNLKVTSKPKRFCCLKWINYQNFKRECPKRITSVIANTLSALLSAGKPAGFTLPISIGESINHKTVRRWLRRRRIIKSKERNTKRYILNK